VSANSTSGVSEFRKSTIAQRIGSVVLAAIVVTYLGLITYSYIGRLHTIRTVVVFAVLMSLGIVALIVLSRPWRNIFRRVGSRSHDAE